jgi:hypothetical protein
MSILAGRTSAAAWLAFCLAVSTGCAAEPWQRSWVVTEVLCSRCSAAERNAAQAALGQKLTLAPDRFNNPLYEDCPSGVDYRDLHSVPRAEAIASMRPGRLPDSLPERVVAGAVRCAMAGSTVPNTVARFVFDNGRGYYLYENGVVLVLR